MSLTRRDLIKAGASFAALASLPRPLLAQFGGAPEPVPGIRDSRIKQLALRAIDAARGAGAAYSDVRLTHTRSRKFVTPPDPPGDVESMVVGVRALVDGCWGFASSPVWSPDEMARLGREAAHQARMNAGAGTRRVELAQVATVVDQHWAMPVDADPFGISPFEITDHLVGLKTFVTRHGGFGAFTHVAEFHVQEKAFASSEGSYLTQRLHRGMGEFTFYYDHPRGGRVVGSLDRLSMAGLGWELYTGQPLRDHLAQLMDGMKEEVRLPVKPVEVGRYDTVCDAMSVARLIDRTLGRATALDVALGYEANAVGTSYLDDPLGMIGSLQAAAPAITLTGNRSERGGVATVRWDDDGVVPSEVTLVKGGVLHDFQTTRESAPWLAEHYAKRGTPVRSHGCAAAPSALEAPLTHSPNLVLAPGTGPRDFDALVSAIGKGVAVRGMGLDMDHQAAGGLGMGQVYEVKDGRRVARLVGAGFLFRAPELWKGIQELGGAPSLRRFGFGETKGEPSQTTYHSVTAPPAAFAQLTVVDVTRKA